MDITELKFQRLKCSRCEWEWFPRAVPVQCPKCKSYYWNEDKDFDRRKKEYKDKEVGVIKKIINKINSQ